MIWTAKSSTVLGITLHTAHCTLISVHCSAQDTLHTAPAPVHFLLHTEHCTLTPHVDNACCTIITSHCKQPKVAWVGFRDVDGKRNPNLGKGNHKQWILANSQQEPGYVDVSVLPNLFYVVVLKEKRFSPTPLCPLYRFVSKLNSK